jgi:biopolymer transport protein ExbD
MAFSGMGSNGGNGRGRFRSSGTLSEMNVVPLVDVVLVLLIIFMLTASTMEFGLGIKAPAVKNVASTPDDVTAVVSVTREGETYLNDKKVNINLIGKAVKDRFKDTKVVYIKADQGLVWGTLASVVSAVNEAGYGIKMVTRLDDSKSKL